MTGLEGHRAMGGIGVSMYNRHRSQHRIPGRLHGQLQDPQRQIPTQCLSVKSIAGDDRAVKVQVERILGEP